MKQLQDEALFYHVKSGADSEFYKVQKAAEANQLLLTPQYLQLEMIRSIGNSTKVYFGPSIQAMYLEFLDMLGSKQLSETRKL